LCVIDVPLQWPCNKHTFSSIHRAHAGTNFPPKSIEHMPPKGSMAFLQNKLRCAPVLGAPKTSRTERARLRGAPIQSESSEWTTMKPCAEGNERCAPDVEIPSGAGVPRSQETAALHNPTVGLCVGPSGDPRGVDVSYVRGTPLCRNNERERPEARGVTIAAPIERRSNLQGLRQ
jgi:hypothetical protein